MRWLVVATVICIAACAMLLALGGSNLMTAAAIVLGGTAFVLVLAIVFYAVGRSEDRERAARESGPNDSAL
jgi:membrane protein implicated in regulation of membrane protease activity